MCWKLTVLSSGIYGVHFQFSDIPQEVKDNRGDYYTRSLDYEINSCSRPEIDIGNRQIFVWGSRMGYDDDELIVSKESFITVVRVLSNNAKVELKGVNKICIGGC